MSLTTIHATRQTALQSFLILQGIKIYKKLSWLNELPADEAEYVFGECCGSPQWARQMAVSRPFSILEQLFTHAEEIWNDLPPEQKVEHFASSGWPTIEANLAKLLER